MYKSVEPVAPTCFGIEIYKGPDFTGIFADGLKFKMLNEHWSKALLMLDLHRVKHTAVGIDADEKFAARLKVPQDLCGVAHVQAL